MTEDAVLLDTAVGAYALGMPHKYREACRRILTAASEDRLRAYASTQMIQKLVHHRVRRTGDRAVAVTGGRNAAALCTLLSFDREVLDLSLHLIERVPTVRGRDAVHVATALAYGIDKIISPDTAFDGIPGLTRLDPLDF